MKYKLIYADPPWKFSNTNTGGSMKSGADNQYPTMTIADLKNLNIPAICDDDCLLVMWWVGSQPKEAIDLIESWGFTIKNMNGFVWNKLTKKGKPHFGMGFYSRAGSESALVAIKGKPTIVDHAVRAVFNDVNSVEYDDKELSFIGNYIVGSHSTKPDEFRTLANRLVGDVPRLEMFARKTTPGWSVFGNEVEHSITIPVNGVCEICGKKVDNKSLCSDCIDLLFGGEQ